MRIPLRLTAAGSAAVLAAAAAFITPWEGVKLRTYSDIVGVDTVCAGETERAAVEEGKRRAYTIAECATMLERALPQYDAGLRGCVTRELPRSVRIAFISATYNIGVHAFCGSSMARNASAGDFRAACDALLLWNRAGGRVVRGLDNRRKAERELCLEDVR